jgi:hypothetical protein
VTGVAAADRWLFLTPEPEVELPAAVAALAAALSEPARGEREETALVEAIVLHGEYAEWLAYLRDRRVLLERYLERFGPDALAGHVVDVLNNHHQLALTVPDRAGLADAERGRVAELMRAIHGPTAR